MILGQSSDDYIWHADEAVRMYEILSSHDNLTPEQAEGQKELLENAKVVQAKGYADKAELDPNPATEDEKKRWLENQVSDDELEIEDDDEEDDDENDDDEMLDVADEGEAEVQMVYGPAWGPETRMMTPRREEARAESDDDEAVQIPEEQPLNVGEGKAKSDDDEEDVQMSEEQQVEGDQASQEQRRPPRISAADKQIIAEGLRASGSTDLATPAASRTATGNLRRTSRRKSSQWTEHLGDWRGK
jgi:hypothetical protein